MSWPTTKAAIRAAVIASLGLPDTTTAVNWNTREVGFGGKCVTLNVLAQQQEGPDRVVKTYNTASGNFDVAVSALVVFTVNVRCEWINADALELCEQARSGLMLPSVRDTLTAAGVAVIGPADSPIPVMGLSADERDVSAYSFDAYFRHEVHRSDPKSLSTIQHVEFSGTSNGNAAGSKTVDRP